MPDFTEDILANVSSNITDFCQGNIECIYDYSVTGMESIGGSTLTEIMKDDDIEAILCK